MSGHHLRTFLLLILPLIAGSVAFAGQNVFWSCDQGGELRMKISGHFFLHNALFQESQKTLGAAALSDAVAQELRYVQGHFVQQKSKGPQLVMRLNAEPEIETLRVQTHPYPFTMNVDKIAHPDVKPWHPYVLAGLTRQHLRRGDSGLKITYTAQVTGLLCGDIQKLKQKALNVELPTEPYLAYYVVPHKDRRRMTWHLSEFVINPCTDPEFADIPDPFYFWYFWKPRNQGSDKDGRQFNCAESLQKLKGSTQAQVKLLSVVKNSASQHSRFELPNDLSNRPLNVTAFFGIVDPKGSRIDFKDLLNRLKNTSAKMDAFELQKAVTQTVFLSEDGPRDPGARNLLNFLRQTHNLLRPENLKVSVDVEKQILILDGDMERSRQAIHLRIFYGDTDALTTASPLYWKNLGSSLKEDDIVLYGGHSGLGENLKLTNLRAQLGAISEQKLLASSPKHQIIGYFSCYSYSYFGDELAQARRSLGAGYSTELVRTASPFTSEKGHLTVLDQVDWQLAQKEKKETGFVVRKFKNNERILITYFDPSPNEARLPAQEVSE